MHTTVWNKNELLRKLKTFLLGHSPKDRKFSWGSRKHQSCSVTFRENSLDFITSMKGLPRWFTCQRRRWKRHMFDPWVRKIPWRRAWQPTPVFMPGESHGQRSLLGYSPWGHKESDTTEWLSTSMKGLLMSDQEGTPENICLIQGFSSLATQSHSLGTFQNMSLALILAQRFRPKRCLGGA